MKNKNILITGGAGFIGSNFVDQLIEDNRVTVLDNFSSGKMEFLQNYSNNKNFRLVKGDMLNTDHLNSALTDADMVIHLAANPDVRVGVTDTRTHLDQNVIATFNLLEQMRIKEVSTILFSSTSTIYGETTIIPTPEHYGPLIPISLYGASKLAAEAYITAYSHNYGMDAVIYRLANIVGPRGTHGVIYDFINKLIKNKKELEVLGDGTQTKSYMYVTDCINGFIFGLENKKRKTEIFNLGSEDYTNVKEIANIVIKEMNLNDVQIKLAGGYEGRGWKGDVKQMLLSIDKIKALGFKFKYNSTEAVIMAARALVKELLGA